MTIKFFLQSKSNPASIYVRVREGVTIDAKANTGYLVNPDCFNKGEIKLYKIPPKANALDKRNIQEENQSLNQLQESLNNLKTNLSSLLNRRENFEIIDTQWLKDKINPKDEKETLPNTLLDYFDKYLEFKKPTLANSTYKRQKSIKARIEKFEKAKGERIYIQNVNMRFSHEFQLWGDSEGYDPNTIKKTLSVIKTVCNHALENGLIVSPDLGRIEKGLKYKYSPNITLTFGELKKIMDTEFLDERLDIARDWLIISCYTAQRVSDFFIFTKERIVNIDGIDLLDIRQKKTDKPVYVPVSDEVKKILKKRNGEFPSSFSENKNSNDVIYNRLIKEVCRKAGIDSIVEVKSKDLKSNRYIMESVKKYKAVTSHIGRRSFATNYYGHIKTSLLIGATGHSTEAQFLRYVGKTDTQNALDLAKAIKELNI